MLYKGSCHCGNISFQVEGEISGAMACNCSICSRKGALMWFVPRDKLQLLTSEQAMSTYTFNKHVIKHRFCSTCGIHPLSDRGDLSRLLQRSSPWPSDRQRPAPHENPASLRLPEQCTAATFHRHPASAKRYRKCRWPRPPGHPHWPHREDWQTKGSFAAQTERAL